MTASVGYTPFPHLQATFNSLYRRLSHYATIHQVYTKPLFSWRKALTMSHDGHTLQEIGLPEQVSETVTIHGYIPATRQKDANFGNLVVIYMDETRPL